MSAEEPIPPAPQFPLPLGQESVLQQELDTQEAQIQALFNIYDVLLGDINVLGGTINRAFPSVDTIKETIQRIWQNILKPLLTRLKEIIERLHRIYNRIIKPILAAIERQRQLIRRIYNIYFRPILVVITEIRVFLRITRLNQTAFGKALDNRLGKLESKVYAPIALALKQLNDQARLLNFILGPDLYFQQVTQLGSVFRDMGQIANVFYNLSTVRDFPSVLGILDNIPPASTPASERQGFQDLLTSGAGNLVASYTADNTAFRHDLALP